MFCLECTKEFQPVTTRQLFCDSTCRNKYNARKRTHSVRAYEQQIVEFFLYEIRCEVNGWCYIGMTTDIDKRWSSHLTQLKTGRHKNVRLQSDFNKFGFDEFVLTVLLRQDMNGSDAYNNMRKIELSHIQKIKLRYNEDGMTRNEQNEMRANLGLHPKTKGGGPRKATKEDLFS